MSKLRSLWFWCRSVWLYPFIALVLSLSLFFVPYSPKEWLYFSNNLEGLETKLVASGNFSEQLEGWFKEVYEIERKEGVAILMNKDQGELADLLALKYECLLVIAEEVAPLDLSVNGLSELKKDVILLQYAQEHGIDWLTQGQAFFYLTLLLNYLQYGGLTWFFIIAFTFQLYKRRQRQSLAQFSFDRASHRWLVSFCYGLLTYLLPFAVIVGVFLVYALLQQVNPLTFPVIVQGEGDLIPLPAAEFFVKSIGYQVFGLLVMHQLIRLMVLLNCDWTLILLGFATGWLPLVVPVGALIWSPFHLVQSFSSLSSSETAVVWQSALPVLLIYLLVFSLGISLLKSWRNLAYL